MNKTSTPALGSLSVIYLLLPSLFFAFGWLRTPFAWLMALLVGAVMVFAGRDLWLTWRGREAHSWRELWPRLAPFLPAALVLLVWMLLSGTGGFGLQNGDYRASNALFKELIQLPWPLQVEIKGQLTKIVYYVNYYLPAAAFGKLFGWGAANVFIFLWTLLGVGLSFLWFWRVSAVRPKWGFLLGLAVLFCLASGLDLIGYFWLRGNPFFWSKHIERWSLLYFQYSAQTTLLFWVPQHTLAAWLVTGMTVDCLHRPQQFKYLGMAIAASILWSPFGVVGIAPYLLVVGGVLLARKAWNALFNWQSLVFNGASLVIAGLSLLYLSSNEYAFPSGLIWTLVKDRTELIQEWAAFWLLEFGLLALVCLLLIWLLHRSGRPLRTDRGTGAPFYLYFLALGILTVLPAYKMGFNNDFVMRVSIPSTFIMWAIVGWLALSVDFKAWPKAALATWVVMLLIVVAGWFTSSSEIIRSVRLYHFGPPDITKVLTTATANKPHTVEQRAGREDTFFYQHIGK